MLNNVIFPNPVIPLSQSTTDRWTRTSVESYNFFDISSEVYKELQGHSSRNSENFCLRVNIMRWRVIYVACRIHDNTFNVLVFIQLYTYMCSILNSNTTFLKQLLQSTFLYNVFYYQQQMKIQLIYRS